MFSSGKQTCDEFGNKMEQRNSKQTYKSEVMGNYVKLVTDGKEIMKHWRQHIKMLF